MERQQVIAKHIANGVKIPCTDGVYIDEEVIIGEGTLIMPNNTISGSSVIGSNCRLEQGNILENVHICDEVKLAYSTVSDSSIGSKTTVGPYAHVHTGSKVDAECRIGNFVEIKNSSLGFNTKAAHLAYIGDADIGYKCNIGCGSIFVNYDGVSKHRSKIGNGVFIGSNSNVVAPVTIEDGAYIAAGSTVTVDLPSNCMCIARCRETIKPDRSKYKKL